MHYYIIVVFILLFWKGDQTLFILAVFENTVYVMFACDVYTLTVKRHYTADLRPRNTESCVIYLFSPVQGRNIGV